MSAESPPRLTGSGDAVPVPTTYAMAKDLALQRVQYAVRRGLGEEVAACQGLLDWKTRIDREIRNAHPGRQTTEPEKWLDALAQRGSDTLSSVVLLVERGCPDQAGALSRCLYE